MPGDAAAETISRHNRGYLVNYGKRPGLALRVLVPAAALAILFAVAAATAGATGSTNITGTATLSAGTLGITIGDTLTWGPTALTGTKTYLVDANTDDQTFDVDDPTGSGAGWHVTASATAFSCSTGACSGDDLGAFTINGSTSDESSLSGPGIACAADASDCTAGVSSGSVTYPKTIATSSTTILDVNASTGLGDNAISNVGWWLLIPSTAVPGTYTSNIVVGVSSGP
jgi:hypothetical protein